ncbi:MAG TPA: choice-of-anchor J domain-containing protein [Gaiellaceae bacterium]|jgi:hypothetical protein|nr:choice-of-anchor J domain-containing protein [Gaiellaceae bacterium]
MSRRFTVCLALLGILALTAPLTVTGAGKAKGKEKAKHVGLVEVGGDYNKGQPLPIRGLKQELRASGSSARASGAQIQAAETPDVGTVQSWVALDDFAGIAYLKDFTLRGVGEHIEVWVASEENVQTDESLPPASELDFPEGDCRNGPRTEITDEQVSYFINEFDTNIYPKESAAFSVPPERAGTDGIFGPGLSRPGEGDNIVVLIDNVRDDNFYDTDNQNGFSYIAGFFWSFSTDVHDRNVMNIDAFDWIHRTGANPPHEPTEDLCTSAPARPFLYEGVFAHEYQHLLEHYEDPDETTWMNEGLSDWAQTLTGYVDPSDPITEIGFDSHIQCFLGNLGIQTDANPIPRDGGPENSLTVWGDQNFDHEWEILCDYGAAYSLMELLAGRYGPDFMTSLHRGDANGLPGLEEALNAFGVNKSPRQILHEWAAAVAVDGVLDGGGKVRGGKSGTYRIPTMNSTINWDNPESYETPGAPPNGSDYVRLRDAAGNYLSARQIESISFDGADTLPALPIEWTVDSNPPDRADDAALYSGSGDNLDRSIVREVEVPAGAASLSFDTMYETEDHWDYGFVQVSTDGGESYTSISCPGMNSDPDPGAIAAIQENVPGFSGSSGGWTTVTCDLSAYAGQTVLLSFRYITDPAVTLPGWWVDNVSVGGTVLSDGSSLDGWQSLTQVNPVEVDDFTVQLVAWDARGKQVTVSTLPLDEAHDGSLTGGALNRSILRKATFVGAIVMYDEPTESVSQYAPYSLEVNGVLQPGGS